MRDHKSGFYALAAQTAFLSRAASEGNAVTAGGTGELERLVGHA
ncbi:hypothetical protein OG410_25155 [Streptomyces sp. NBC_00659]|nr:hypothetical protein [Streptomyces sp. NBC_00659]